MTETYPIIGMSPGNSYFKDEVVKELVQKVVSKYGKTIVFVADIPAISTYIALGYPTNRARRDKALPQGNALKNRVTKAMQKLGYSTDQVRIIDWESEVARDQGYLAKRQEIQNLYDTNQAFKEAANDATKSVLEYSEKPIANMDSAIKIAVDYLLCEFAFLELAPAFLKAEKVTYVYHKEWPVYESYRLGAFDKKPREYLLSEVVTTQEEN